MNNSERTRDMARGIYFWACLQDMPVDNQKTIEYKAWKSWADKHSESAIKFVQKEQFNLFDRCNALDWKG